jgi:hypothetical protein
MKIEKENTHQEIHQGNQFREKRHTGSKSWTEEKRPVREEVSPFWVDIVQRFGHWKWRLMDRKNRRTEYRLIDDRKSDWLLTDWLFVYSSSCGTLSSQDFLPFSPSNYTWFIYQFPVLTNHSQTRFVLPSIRLEFYREQSLWAKTFRELTLLVNYPKRGKKVCLTSWVRFSLSSCVLFVQFDSTKHETGQF